MALGNWTEYINRHDKKTLEFQDYWPGIYKNWIYIYHKNRKPIAEFWEGKLDFSSFNLIATRGPQNGVYFCLWQGYEHKKNLIRLSGIGCYGYDPKGGDDWVGILPESKEFLADFVEKVNWDFWFDN